MYIEKGAFGSPSTTVANLYIYMYIYIYIYIYIYFFSNLSMYLSIFCGPGKSLC